MFNTDNRVFEETSRTACHLGTGQLAPTHLGNSVCQLGRSGAGDACSQQRVGESFIADVGCKGSVQTEHDRPDHITTFEFMLEDAVAIAKATFVIAEHTLYARTQLIGTNAMDYIFCLSAVGSNVLHRCGTHCAGNCHEVFYAIPPL